MPQRTTPASDGLGIRELALPGACPVWT